MNLFDRISTHWKATHSTRIEIACNIPLPNASYLTSIKSLHHLSMLTVRCIEKPILLAVDTILYTIISCIRLICLVAFIPALLLINLLHKRCDFVEGSNNAYMDDVAHTLVVIAVTALTAISALLAIIFNPIFLAFRLAKTGVDYMEQVLCCSQ